MKQRITCVLLPVFFTVQLLAGDEGNTVSAILKSATVYRNSADLTHIAKAILKQGDNDLIIDDISNTIDIASLRINCTASVTILSAEFSKEFLKPESLTSSVKKIMDSMGLLHNELLKLDVLIKSDNGLLELLDVNKDIRGTQTALRVTELTSMVDYYRQKSLEIRNELNSYNEKKNRIDAQMAKLQEQVDEEEKKNSKTTGRLTLQLFSPQAGPVDFTISYLTAAAHWKPSYDLRMDNVKDPLKLLYKATIAQTSGIDWKKIKLSLSTAMPSQNNTAPVLKTWFLRYLEPVAWMPNTNVQGYASTALTGSVAGVQIRGASSLNETVRISGADDRETTVLYVVNGKMISETEFQRIDKRAIATTKILNGKESSAIYGSSGAGGAVVVTLKDELGDYVAVNDNTLDVVFDIDIPYDIPNNGKEQSLVLKTDNAPSLYNYYAAPISNGNAYLLAEIPGWQRLNLLPAEAVIVLEGTYMGKTFIDPASVSDTFNLTMGVDKRVVIKRQKLTDYSSVKFLGSNKKQVFTYDITVKNNKKEKISMILKDQYPISSDKEIESALLESSGSEDNNETGILTWKFDLAPGEIKKFRLSYAVKFPKEKTININ